MFPAPEARAHRILPARAAHAPETASADAGEHVAEITLTTHRVTYSDRLKVFIGPDEDVDSFLRPLRRMDGMQRYALEVSLLPEPLPATEVTPAVSAARGDHALSCVGSADAMAIHLRSTVDHVSRTHVLGLEGTRAGLPTVYLPHGTDETYVYPEEVFTAQHALAIFRTWFRSGRLPGGLQRRELLD
ncbi:hypothetical protein ACWEQ0_14400 [Nocardia thailandica]|uniref:Uncharacterized protein n=1 Tax=Nocardia thailandica TaxID=257275 RepID=A0ABW6PKG9_9NOCA